jgi:hypothetical protein
VHAEAVLATEDRTEIVLAGKRSAGSVGRRRLRDAHPNCIQASRRNRKVVTRMAAASVTFCVRNTSEQEGCAGQWRNERHFCPICGSTVYWEGEGFPGYVAVADRQLRRPKLPGTQHRGVGGVTPPVGLLATRYATHASGEAGVRRYAISQRAMTRLRQEGRDWLG